MAHVVLKGVTKRFEDAAVPAVRDVSFEVRDREFMVLVGPSGCGKSTTLRMIAGLEEVSEGDILIDGRRVNDVPPKDRDIAMVFQNYALYPHMTVRENLAFSLKMRKTPKAEVADRVSEAARILGIGDLLDRRPKALSGGQRQRVALGRALVREPKVFLFDEPLSNLDARLRVQMRAELVKLHEALGATVIYVTHDQVEAMTMGSRIAVMEAGAVQQVDRPLAIYRRPANAFVAGFIGSPAMNFIEGRISPDSGTLRFTPQEGDWSVPLPAALPVEGAEHGSHSVRLGVRPEHLHLSEGSGPDTIPAEVELSEPLGYDTYLTCRVGPDRLVVRAPGDTDLESGTPVAIALEGPGAHLFDPVTGQRI